MPNAWHAIRMHTLPSFTALWAISRLQDGLNTFNERLRHDLRLELFLKVHHFFNRRYSSSKSLIRNIMDTSMTPYLVRRF
jgi:hypothetical protein